LPNFVQWLHTVDREATIAAYKRADHGGADTCDCSGCRNFRLARKLVFPDEFVALLDQLGIDPSKDAEVYHNARLSPGCHHYGGWFHFIGTIDGEGDSSHVRLAGAFESWLCPASAPRLSAFNGLPLVQLEFIAEAVPWLLAEPELP
jgi:hypothetical protein